MRKRLLTAETDTHKFSIYQDGLFSQTDPNDVQVQFHIIIDDKTNPARSVDYLQDTLEHAFEIAEEDFGLKRNMWIEAASD